MTLFRFFIIIIVIYLVFRVLVRYLLPYLVRRYIEKQKEKFYNSGPFADYNANRQQSKEGEINIHKKPQQNQSKEKIGEYVDFEDIE